MFQLKPGRAIMATVLAVVLVALAIWAVTSRTDNSSATPTVGSSATSSTEGSASDDDDQTTGVQPDPVAPSSVGPAARPGATLDPTLVVEPQPLGSVSTYPDGVSVTVGDATQQKVVGQGPGSINSTVTIFEVTVKDDRKAPLDLSAVVVSAVYGAAPGRLADPNYDVAEHDFSGVLRPGRSSTARYGFAIPTKALGDISLSIDLDGSRSPAVFTGTARS